MIIEDELHSRSGPQPTDAFPRLGMGYDFAIGIGPSTPNFLKLSIGQPDVPDVFDIIEERLRADPAWTVHTIACAHNVVRYAPDETFDVLMETARKVAAA